MSNDTVCYANAVLFKKKHFSVLGFFLQVCPCPKNSENSVTARKYKDVSTPLLLDMLVMTTISHTVHPGLLSRQEGETFICQLVERSTDEMYLTKRTD